MFFCLLFIQAIKSILEIDVSLNEEKIYKFLLEDMIILHLDEKIGHFIISGKGLEIKINTDKSLLENHNEWYTLNEQINKNEYLYSKDSNVLATVLIQNKNPFNKTIKVTTGPLIINTRGYLKNKFDIFQNENDNGHYFLYEDNYTKLSDTPRGKSKKKNNSIGLYVSIGVLAFYGLALIIIVLVIIIAVCKESCKYRNEMYSSRGEGENNVEKYDEHQNDEEPDFEQIDTPNMQQYDNPYAQPVEEYND